MREYNYRTVYDCFKNKFPVDGFIPYMNLPPITIDDISRPPKTSGYTSDTLPSAIYVTSVKYVSMFTTPSDSPQLFVLYYDDTDTQHITMIENPFHISMKIGYCSKFHDEKICYKNRGSIALCVQLAKGCITVMELL